MGQRVERWLPREERRAALWLAGTMAVLALLPQLRLPVLESPEIPWPSMLAWVAVYAAAVGALLVLARRAFHAPRAIAGLVLLDAIVTLPLAVLSAALGLGQDALLAGTPWTSSGSAPLMSFLWTVLPAAAVLVVAALALFAVAMLQAERDLSAGDDPGRALSRAWRRFLEAAGLDGSEPVDRRLAVAFVLVSAVSSATYGILSMPLQVLAMRSAPLTGPAPGSTAIENAANILRFVLMLALPYLVVRLAIVRRHAPRAVWLAVAGPLAGAIVNVAILASWGVGVGGLDALTTGVAMLATVGGVAALQTAAAMLAVPRLPAAPPLPSAEERVAGSA